MRRSEEKGSVLPLMAVFMLAMAAMAWLVVLAANQATAAAQCQTAADAAALAGVNGDVSAVTNAAQANSAVLEDVATSIDEARATVALGDRRCQARARAS